MGDLIGHWKNLAEAQKLTQPDLIPGVIEEDIKRENPLDRSPVALAKGSSIKWNREKVTLEDDVQKASIGTSRVWTSSMEYDQKETTLTVLSISRLLNKFISEIYKTFNNYEALMLLEAEKGLKRKIGEQIIYGDYTYGTNEFDGWHAWAAEQSGITNDIDIDGASGAMSLAYLRRAEDEMRYGIDYWYFPSIFKKWIDSAYQERGFGVTTTTQTIGRLTWALNDTGKPVPFWNGTPIIYSDYLVAEQEDTGRGSQARAAWSSSTKVYSIFGVKYGDLYQVGGVPGFCMAFGNEEQRANFWEVEYFDKLETYVGTKGLGLLSYIGGLLGSKRCLVRIHDITDAAITV